MDEIMEQALTPFAPKPRTTTHDLEQRLRNHSRTPGINEFMRADLLAAADRLVELAHREQKTPRQLAEDDRLRFGQGFVRVHRDGTEEYLPLDQVVVHGTALHVKNPSR